MKNFINISLTLAYKDFKSDWRRKSALGSIVLYVLATVYTCYLGFNQRIDAITWNTLHWIIIIFASINTVAKSFIQESPGRMLYYHSIAHPTEILTGKLIYNTLLTVSMGIVNFIVYSMLLGNPVSNFAQYFTVLVLCCVALSGVLSMTSAIAAKSQQGSIIMSVLSMPLLLPILICVVRASKNAMDGLEWVVNTKYILMLGAMDILVFTLACLLFPYLWKE